MFFKAKKVIPKNKTCVLSFGVLYIDVNIYNDIPVGDGKIYNLVLQCGMSPDYTLPGREYFSLRGVFPRSGPGDARKS